MAPLWLDPAKTSPYQFHQYWVQLPDDDVERFLLQLTFRPVEDVRELVAAHGQAPERRLAQRALADDVTTIVHGAAAATAAAEAAAVLFGGDPLGASAGALAAAGRGGAVVAVDERAPRRRRRAAHRHRAGHVPTATPGASCSRAASRRTA